MPNSAGAGIARAAVSTNPPPPPGACVWITGLPSAGKTTLGRALVAALARREIDAELLDGDELRTSVSRDLGFDRASRERHAARAVFVASRLSAHGIWSVASLIAPYRRSRSFARAHLPRFLEVYLAPPLSVCVERDVKGLYRAARDGKLEHLTGLDDPYEPPERPELVIDTSRTTAERATGLILEALGERGWTEDPEPRHPTGSSAMVPAI